ncbi:hypothetical protein NKH77_00855 [Streptomyces sp. M19]
MSLDDDNVCSLCRLGMVGELLENFSYTDQVHEEFTRGGPNPHGPYDCLFMYSGGKDSTFMLDKFVNSYGKRVLAYTFDVPFESTHAADNIALAGRRSRHVRRRLRRRQSETGHAGGVPAAGDQAGPLPRREAPVCLLPLVLRDPRDHLRVPAPHPVHRAVRGPAADPHHGVRHPGGGQGLLPDLRPAADRHGLPQRGRGGALRRRGGPAQDRLPVRRAALPVRPDGIVEELKAKGLYNSSPLETHCTLFPLLNYYSFKHWNCMFYKLNASSHRRSVRRNKNYDRSTFSITFPRATDLPRSRSG